MLTDHGCTTVRFGPVILVISRAAAKGCAQVHGIEVRGDDPAVTGDRVVGHVA
ncbi:hypothetical protein ILP97_00515 [Amycolatopsis sp. H6(2020)]|nr:hypothetical protein [Amycolatopsis sp. H6(2020)]